MCSHTHAISPEPHAHRAEPRQPAPDTSPFTRLQGHDRHTREATWSVVLMYLLYIQPACPAYNLIVLESIDDSAASAIALLNMNSSPESWGELYGEPERS